jgi:hypothetical protein
MNSNVCATHHVMGRRHLFDTSLDPRAFTSLFTHPVAAKISINKVAHMATPYGPMLKQAIHQDVGTIYQIDSTGSAVIRGTRSHLSR